MKIIKPDDRELEKEQSKSEKKKLEKKLRDDYLKKLKVDSNFQKYVVQEILQNSLDETFSLDSLPLSDDLDRLGGIALQYIIARRHVKKLMAKLI